MDIDDLFGYLFFGFMLFVIANYFYSLVKDEARKNYISLYVFPKSLPQKILNSYPHLSQMDIELVFKALKEYFNVCNTAQMKMVSMPSKVVDVAWHEFILFTREYEEFCNRGFGKFLHHTLQKL